MSGEKKLIRNSTAEFLFFTGQNSTQRIEARYHEKTVWLTQRLMTVLFKMTVAIISEHLKNIYDQGEITREATIRKFQTVQIVGSREVERNMDFDNPDFVISVFEGIP
jgi:hypothetical protein